MNRSACTLAIAAAVLAGCRAEQRTSEQEAPPMPSIQSLGLGHAASPAEIAALDIDASPSGEGLPAGRGDATRGEALYKVQCAVCHGDQGQGIPPYPKLIGREPREGFPFANDAKLAKTIGNYWPYATTVFDYIRRAMPLDKPGTLSNDDVYSLTAFLLAANEILPAGGSLDSATLVAVKMPAHDHFVRDDRKGGAEVR